MKKKLFTLTVCACLFASVNAQNTRSLNQNVNLRNDIVTNTHKTAASIQTLNANIANKATVINKSDLFKVQAKGVAYAEEEPTISALYAYPKGALYAGVYPDGWYSNIMMYTPALEDITFLNYSSYDETKPVTFTWTDGSGKEMEQVGEDCDGVGQLFGSNYFPTLTMQQEAQTSSFIPTNTNGNKAAWYAGTEAYESLSNASPGLGVYNGFQNGPSLATNKLFYNTEKNAVGFCQFYEKPIGHVLAQSAYIMLKPTEGTLSETPLEGKTITLKILKSTENGLETYATATATDENVTKIGTSGIFTITFNFVTEDPLFGEVEEPIVLDDNFVVMITGFETITISYTALFADADGWNGNGYVILSDGKLSTVGYSNAPSTPRLNLHIGFSAAIPVALPTNEETVVDIPVEGGLGVTLRDGENVYNDYDVYTMSDIDNWNIVDCPEWITMKHNNSYLSRGFMLFYFNGEALPAGQTYRTGTVVLELFGKTISIPVKQGDVPAGIDGINKDNVKKSITYNLMGQRVNSNAKGIVIKDGKKIINK